MKKILHKQTLESLKSRCIEEGNCWIWQGACDGHGRPQTRHDGRVWYVRRLVRTLVDGKPVPADRSAACKCGNAGCVSPACSVVCTTKEKARMAAQRQAYGRPDKLRRMTETKRAQSRITEEMVREIRDMDGPASRISEVMGVSLSHVKAIRSGRARVDYRSNPFASLIAANYSQARARA